MKTRVVSSPSLSRRAVLALCVGAALAAFSASPGVARAEAMSDDDFVALCESGAPEQVKQALENGANPNAEQISDGMYFATALMGAALNPNPEVTRLLLAAGAKVNARDSKTGEMTALQVAAGYNRVEVAAALLEAGADARFGNDAALMEAATHNRRPEVVRALLEAGAEVNARGGEALRNAALQNGLEVVRALLDAGADKSLKDKNGHDALWHAREGAKEGYRNTVNEAERRAEDEKVIRLLESGGGKKPAPARAADTETSRVRAAAERLRTGEDSSPEAAAAANSLGVWHEKGRHGLRRDMREAARWYGLAAEHGNALAMHNLGDLYRQGKGVRQDSREAFRWYEKAADAGHALGLEDMADCYLKGVGVAQNRGEAVRLYREAARQGRKSAAQKLREMGE